MVARAFERMLLESKDSALHAIFVLIHNEQAVAQMLALPPALPARQMNDIVKAMPADMCALSLRVLVAAFPTNVS